MSREELQKIDERWDIAIPDFVTASDNRRMKRCPWARLVKKLLIRRKKTWVSLVKKLLIQRKKRLKRLICAELEKAYRINPYFEVIFPRGVYPDEAHPLFRSMFDGVGEYVIIRLTEERPDQSVENWQCATLQSSSHLASSSLEASS